MNGLVRVTTRRHDVYRSSIQGSVYGSDRLLDSMKVERSRKGKMKGLLLWFWDDNVPATLGRVMALEQTQLTLHLCHVKSRIRTAQGTHVIRAPNARYRRGRVQVSRALPLTPARGRPPQPPKTFINVIIKRLAADKALLPGRTGEQTQCFSQCA